VVPTVNRCQIPTMQELSSRLALLALAAVFTSAGCSSPDPPPLPTCVVPIGVSPQRGPADAWVTIVEFADFQCPYCGMAESTINAVDQARPGLRWVFKHFPLSQHQYAVAAALAADCANQQGMFWEMHDTLFAHQSSLGDTALTSYAVALGLDIEAWNTCRTSSEAIQRIKDDFDLGLEIGVGATPTFFIDGIPLEGAESEDVFLGVVDRAEKAAKKSGIAQSDYYGRREKQGCKGL
jgi:protein-disulfide isomerase